MSILNFLTILTLYLPIVACSCDSICTAHKDTKALLTHSTSDEQIINHLIHSIKHQGEADTMETFGLFAA